jgi:TatA/E family protein of Tat protein translocase
VIYDSLLMFESPIQILIVLTIALLVFGPKKLPEIGRQIGGALRELRKAAGEVSKSFTTDYEPDTGAYSYEGGASSYDKTASYYSPPPALDAPMDLSDYTIVGVTAPDAGEPTEVGAGPEPDGAADLGDYTLIGSLAPAGEQPGHEAAGVVEDGAPGSGAQARPADGARP